MYGVASMRSRVSGVPESFLEHVLALDIGLQFDAREERARKLSVQRVARPTGWGS